MVQKRIGECRSGARPVPEEKRWEKREEIQEVRKKMHELKEELGFKQWQAISDQKFLVMQPLFRAVTIVIRSGDHSTAGPPMAQLPVLLVLTGVEEGLSAPISFSSIADKIDAHHRIDDSIRAAKTNLATAVDFVMDLEKRALATFGPRPDPAETCKEPRQSFFLGDMEALILARRDGWEGDEPPEGPSSTWIDASIYPEWSGAGRDVDTYCRGKEAARWRERAATYEQAFSDPEQ